MTPRLAVVVMAHRKRKHMIPNLLAALDRPAQVVWDRRDDRWDTGRRAWQTIDRHATHGLVIQDDAVVCRDLAAGVEQALAHVPADSPVCLYAGRVQPFRDLVQRLVGQATEDVSWLTMTQIHWGVGIVLPTGLINDMLTWCDQRDVANYDKRISRWCQSRDLTVYYPWPSLVDHRVSPSLVPGRSHAGRHAHRFLGTGQSALDQQWDGRAVTLPALNAAEPLTHSDRWTGGTPVLFASIKYPNLDLSNKPGLHGVRFRGGLCEVTRPNAISILQSPWWQRRGIRIATEQDREAQVAMPDSAPAAQNPVEPEAPCAEVPTGTAGDVQAWVGDDPARARRALDTELQREKPRKGLVSRLTTVAETPTSAAIQPTSVVHQPSSTGGFSDG